MNILCKTSIILMGCETMTVKLEQYRIFKAIADTGNISRTAKQLYLSQSAVSQSLQQLESALGVRLFSRTARGVTLTAEGSVLYDYAALRRMAPRLHRPRRLRSWVPAAEQRNP